MNRPELPQAFVRRIKEQLGPEADNFLDAQHSAPPISVRINTRKYAGMPELDPIPWCTTGYYLNERPVFTLDPLFHAGAYYVQEASSMLLEQAIFQHVGLDTPLRVLDLCAAPGGKSTLISSLIGKDSLLVANEVIRSRAEILAENLTKWGAPNVIITNNDPRDFQRLEGFFDLIVVDAPCSGEGLFRKDPDAAREWSVENTNLCAERQRRILSDVWPALKPGGILVYSTCTFNPAENEDNIAWLAKDTQASPLELKLQAGWGIGQAEVNGKPAGYQLLPHRAKGEGFFLSIVRKTGGNEWKPGKKDKFPLAGAGKHEAAMVEKWLLKPADFYLHHETILAFPPDSTSVWSQVLQQLKIVQAGVPLAEIKKKNLVPTPNLALSTLLKAGAFTQEELGLREALRYLRKEEWPVERTSDGWQLITYRQLPLGWVKRIGTRFNNYFPVNWRIRMELPAELPQPFLC